jgi:hypothetical protein
VGGGDTDGDGEHGSLIDLDADAETGGEAGGGLLDDPLGGDLLGGDLVSGMLVDDVLGSGSDGSDPSLLNVDVDGHTATDGSTIDLGAEEIIGDDSPVTELVETVEDTVDQIAGDFAGGDLLGGDLLGGDLLGGLDIGETLAQLGSGDLGLLDTGLTEDLADVGAITGIINEVVDTGTSAVDGLLGETDLFNILDTDGLLGDG